MMRTILTMAVALLALTASGQRKAPPPVQHSHTGQTMTAEGGVLTITNIGKKQNYDWRDRNTRDEDIFSPKSVNFHPDGSKYYVNSLEGCATVVYDRHTGRKLNVIQHRHDSGQGALWGSPSDIYRFKHYGDGRQRAFSGKPVEGAFSHGGRYLWVPYYRRSFDLNAQDPSAVAIIDTRTDSIVRMMDTGPLPKMVACSHDSRVMAITHWGNNTVGLIDISDSLPSQWHHLPYVVIDKELQLNYSLTTEVNRDANSGLLLRGTVFTPDDRYLLVSCMGGGGIAVVDMRPQPRYVGKIEGISNARHLIIKNNYLFASVNAAGLVQRIALDSVLSAIEHRQGSRIGLRGWATCKVGGGARTIEASPSGRYVFAACNSASALYVVDATAMKAIGQITIDSYPVGLDISDDGRFLVVTSQARNYHGGNAVNLLRVDYADSLEQQAFQASLAADAAPTADAMAPDTQQRDTSLVSRCRSWLTDNALVVGTVAGIVVVLLAGWLVLRR